MATRPKPYRTRHRNLNEDAINKLYRVRHLMISLISRHIQPCDQSGLDLADEITNLFLSVLTDLEEERRILDSGINATEIDHLWTAIHKLEEQHHGYR
jgi:hypothetical protein